MGFSVVQNLDFAANRKLVIGGALWHCLPSFSFRSSVDSANIVIGSTSLAQSSSLTIPSCPPYPEMAKKSEMMGSAV
ncbi:unnamed protein product [Gongylonema pulchrum]|uniref:Uncharacterized protein n=1 Tax=Gongylonema pulchrum TaxID=637853 RepID=A0A183EB16_9BILA|nr:unnamed protein product [Gongylonema pulchrum]